jgi:hypothetical protein
VYSPHTYLDLARSRQEELLQSARRIRVRRASWSERRGWLRRLAASLLRRPRQPATA